MPRVLTLDEHELRAATALLCPSPELEAEPESIAVGRVRLQARELLDRTQTRLDPAVVELLSVCLRPDASVAAAVNARGSRTSRFTLHRLGAACVEHSHQADAAGTQLHTF